MNPRAPQIYCAREIVARDTAPRWEPTLLADPPDRGHGRIVARGTCSHDSALCELQELFLERYAWCPHLACNLGVFDACPESIRTYEQDIVRLERAATSKRHVRNDRIATQATLHEVAHGMRLRLIGSDESLAQQKLDVTMVPAS